MKLIQTPRDVLLKPLQAVSGIVEKRNTLPILSNVLIERQADRLNLLATDLEIQVMTGFGCDKAAAESSQITVSARKLQDILRALPDDAQTTLEVQPNRLQVRSGKSRFTLQTLPAEDFPRLAPAGDGGTTVTLPQRALRALFLLVQYAMAQQDIRYYLNGLLIALDEGRLKMVATDGHRLAYASRALDGATGKAEVILPRKAVLELVKLLSDSDDPVTMEMSSSQVRFSFGDIQLISKVIDGKFPDYERVIPTNYDKQFLIQRPVLLAALHRAAILSNEKFRGVRWMLGAGSLSISCTNNEQEEAQDELDIDYGGEAIDIGFNINYVLDVLTNVQAESVQCAFGDANSSMLMTLPDDADFRYVVMPMRI
jgi:DNA polymerase-3 subunit beta